MSINSVMAGLAVADFDAALAWYERLLGRPADDRPMDGLADWRVPGTGVIQVIQDPERAGKGLLTLSVDNLRGHVAELDDRGVDAGPVDETTSAKVLFATVDDPEGNRITLVEQRS
jgi:catechol 2,3-dioxygenase-like lactoylglutathione lyase family enzyme